MRIASITLLCTVGLGLVDNSNAEPRWDSIRKSTGQLFFFDTQGSKWGQAFTEYGGTQIEFGRGGVGKMDRDDWNGGKEEEGALWVTQKFTKSPDRFFGYGIYVNGTTHTHTEYTHVRRGTHHNVHDTWVSKGAKDMISEAYKNENTHNELYTFEALQRLVTPQGLLQQILTSVFDPEGHRSYTERVVNEGDLATIRDYKFHVTNDNEKHYTDAQLNKLYTTWESVLGSDNAVAKTHKHLAKFRLPIRHVHVTVWEYKNGNMRVMDFSFYSTPNPKHSDEAILSFRNDRESDGV
eukprot:GDKI01025125.1.p1 GENE.GDKI01025125.1~~GDKI01025125.1.p1  ORF type:complete len:294 (-),score=86.35 GDKI01025125.1:347-1228(-)